MFFNFNTVRYITILILLNSALICNIYGAKDTTLINNSKDSVSLSIDSIKNTEKDTTSKKNEITDTVHYESELISYDNEEKILILTGKARVKYQNMQLIADTIVYTIDDNIFTASGLPYLIEKNDTTFGDYMVYNIKTRRGRVRSASTSLTDGHFNGSRIIKTEDNVLFVDQGDYTTCQHVEDPHYFFYGKKIKVIPNDKIISKPVVMNIGNTPVAVLPFFIFPMDRDRRSGWLTPVWGGHPTSGGFIDNIGYYWAPNDYIDFLTRGKVNDFQEFVAEAASNYNLKYKFNGYLNGRYSFNNEFSKSSRDWAINYSHNQTLTPDNLTKLTGSGSLTSSKNFFYNNSENSDEFLNQVISANMSFSKTFDDINASTNVTWRRTHYLNNGFIDEDLPSVNFNLPSRPIFKAPDTLTGDKTPWYSKFYYGYSANGIVKHLDSTRVGGKEFFRPGAQHSLVLTAPQKIFNHINVSPSFNASQYFVYGYSDTAVLRYDTLIDSVSYIRRPPFGYDNNHPDYILDSIFDTLSYNQFGEPDSISVKRYRKRIITQHNNYEKFANIENWNAGLSISTKLYGLFPIKLFNLAGIRHSLTPSLSYTFHPERQCDKRYYATGINPPGAQKQQQIVGMSIGNLFEGKITKLNEEKKLTENTFTILSTDLSTGYDFEKKSRQWSDLLLNASSSISKLGLSVGYNSSFWLYDQYDNLSAPIMNSMSLTIGSGTLNASGTLWNGDLMDLDSLSKPDPYSSLAEKTGSALKWSASLNPTFLFSMSRSRPSDMFIPQKSFNLSGSASINFTKAWSFQWNGSYNFEKDQWVNNNFNLNCDLECWEMKFNWRPEKLNPGYYFLINIKKIPEIKWEQRNY